MQEVLVDRGEFVVEDLVEVSDDVDVALHGVAPVCRSRAADAAPESRSLRGRPLRSKLFAVEEFARAGFARAAAGRDTGARLQLFEGTCSLDDGLLESTFGDAVAETDVHGTYLARDRNPRAARAGMQTIRI
jgi:hypothetical protein